MTAKRVPAILLFGAPGVGKGTQGAILDQIPGFRHVSSGEFFRALDRNSLEGKEAREYSRQGKLVPDDLTIRIFNSSLQKMIDEGAYDPDAEILVLDGIPRTVKQAEILRESIEVLSVFFFMFSDDSVMIERMKIRAIEENRVDDSDEDTIRFRFDEYRRKTKPVLQQFPPDRVHEIDALLTPIEVTQSVLEILVPVTRDYLAARQAQCETA